MPSVSKKQRRFMAMVEHTPKSELSGKAAKAKGSMTHEQLHEFAATKEKGLPTRKHKRQERARSKYQGA
jgi:hypothetical protein